MSEFFEGRLYPYKLYNELIHCFNKWGDSHLEEAQDVSWEQFYSYWLSDGMGDDTWGSRDAVYYETRANKTAFFGSVPRIYEVQEKCNFVSNVAYYRAAIRICDYPDWTIPQDYQIALMKVMATLGTGSGWFHGSITELGRQLDGYLVALAINNAYQIAIRSVDTKSRTILTVSDNLEPTPMQELADDAAYMSLRKNVSEWENYLRELQVVRGYTKTAVAIGAFGCVSLAPFWFCRSLVCGLAETLLNDEEKDFMLNKYMPEVRDLVVRENLPIPCWRAIPLLKKFLGVLFGLLWAFLFQEEQIETPCLEGNFFNFTRLGAFKSPWIDFLSFQLHRVENTEKISRQPPYPGGAFCNRDSPHALWHERSADSLIELYAVVDELDDAIIKHKRNQKRRLQDDGNNSFISRLLPMVQGLRGTSGSEEKASPRAKHG